ncbi:MAG: hypothetical protein JWM10_1451, partial [Myxococcaceae bacterium]|nr:hypothetical protein [Myxococcaceae bacterium]
LRGFVVALRSPGVAADLEGAHAYNAACVALRAAGDGAPSWASPADLEAHALQWLAYDLDRRRAAHARDVVASPRSDESAGAADAALRRHVRRLDDDPDLAGIRGDGRLEALFAAPPAAP